jgi:hypothetical protein
LNPRPPVEGLREPRLAPSSVAPFHTLGAPIARGEGALRVACNTRGASVARNASLLFSVGWPRGPTSSIRGPYAPAPTISRLGHAGQQSCCARRHTFRASQLVHLLFNPFWRIARRMGNTEPLSRTATRRPDYRPVSPPRRMPTFRSRRLCRSVSPVALSGLAVPLPVSPTGPYTPAAYNRAVNAGQTDLNLCVPHARPRWTRPSSYRTHPSCPTAD